MSARRRRRGPEGQRKAAGAWRCAVSPGGQPAAGGAAPPCSQRLARVAIPVRWPATAWRAPRALEDVERVVTASSIASILKPSSSSRYNIYILPDAFRVGNNIEDYCCNR